MKTLLLCLSLLSTPFLMADDLPENPTKVDTSGTLSSTSASYDGNALLLTGHVVLDHGLGKMTAEEASLQRQESGKEFPFSAISLRKEVLLALKNNAQISCTAADLDFTALKGYLTASLEEKVIYTDTLKKKKGGKSQPLKLAGQAVELTFSKQLHDGKSADYDVTTVLAKEGVTVNYAESYELNADHALYRRMPPQDSKGADREFQGLLTAYPKEDGAPCRVTREGDVIDAEMIDLDLIHSKLSLFHPKGTLTSTPLPQLESSTFTFQADQLLWDHLKNTLLLKGRIQIVEESLGTLSALEELTIDRTLKEGKLTLSTLHTQGPTLLTYRDPLSQTPHSLRSHGTLHIDRLNFSATATSPETSGEVAPEHQLLYEDTEALIFADTAALEYALINGKMSPSTLTLKGHIRLSSKDTTAPKRMGSADRLTYSLDTKTLILSASPGHKVLFFDEAQGLNISAKEVHVVTHPETKDQSIQGVGNVQFTFTPEERAKLELLFPNTRNPHEQKKSTDS